MSLTDIEVIKVPETGYKKKKCISAFLDPLKYIQIMLIRKIYLKFIVQTCTSSSYVRFNFKNGVYRSFNLNISRHF